MRSQIIISSGGRSRPGFQKNRLIQMEDAPHGYGTPGQVIISDSANPGFVLADLPLISRGASVYNPDGIGTALNLIVWRCPDTYTLMAIHGYRIGGTGATINTIVNFPSTGDVENLVNDLSLETAGEWLTAPGEDLQNINYIGGCTLIVEILTLAGGPTQIAIQADFRRKY